MAHWRDNPTMHMEQFFEGDELVGVYHLDYQGRWPWSVLTGDGWRDGWSPSEVDAKANVETIRKQVKEQDMANKRNNSWKGEGPSAESSDAKAEPLEAADVNVRAMTDEEESALTVQAGVTHGAGEHPPKRTRKPRGTGKPRSRKPKNANGLGAQADAYLKRYMELKQHVTAAEAALQAHADSVDESVIRAARALKDLQNEEAES
jgi:hypothetical protein